MAKINKKTGQIYKTDELAKIQEDRGVSLENYEPKSNAPTLKINDKVVTAEEYKQEKEKAKIISEGGVKAITPQEKAAQVEQFKKVQEAGQTTPEIINPEKDNGLLSAVGTAAESRGISDIIGLPQTEINPANALTPEQRGAVTLAGGALAGGALAGSAVIAFASERIALRGVTKAITSKIGASSGTIRGLLAFGGLSSVGGITASRVANIEAEVGKYGETMGYIVSNVQYGGDPIIAMGQLAQIELSLNEAEEKLKRRKIISPLTLLTGRDEKIMLEIEKQRAALASRRQQVLIYAASPIPANVGALKMLEQEINDETS